MGKIVHVGERRMRLKTAPLYLDLLKDTINDIENFGKEEGKSLGFYLKEHENTDWFPIPYLKILRSLFVDSLERKEQSTLSMWQKRV